MSKEFDPERRKRLLVTLPVLEQEVREKLAAPYLTLWERRMLEHTLRKLPYVYTRLHTIDNASDFSLSKFVPTGPERRMLAQWCEVKQLRTFFERSLAWMEHRLQMEGLRMPFVLKRLHLLYHGME